MHTAHFLRAGAWVKRGSAATVCTTLLSAKSAVRMEERAEESRLGRVATMRARVSCRAAAEVDALLEAALPAADLERFIERKKG